MSTLHLFNPSHDEALAANSAYYYPSKAARHLRSEWAMLPCLWASEGDAVWVDNESEAACPWRSNVTCVKAQEMNAQFWQHIDRIEPWGWDALVRHQLLKAGAPVHLLPTNEQLQQIRQLSSRHTTAMLLPLIREKLSARGIASAGLSQIVTNEEQVATFVEQHGQTMAKSLWSCSGRGVFPLTPHPTESERGRVRKLLREQGGLELEPLYEGVTNFALEFDITQEGGASYAGPSVFSTSTAGNYLGNLVAPTPLLEKQLEEQGVRLQPLVEVCLETLNETIAEKYTGPLGIDMMLVRQGGEAVLHPCIELNLRLTMGRVAVLLQQKGWTKMPKPFDSLFCFKEN